MQQHTRFHGSHPAFRGHFEHWVLEELQLLTHDWYDEPLYPTWRSTKDFADTGEKFGVVPRQQPAGDGAEAAGQEDGGRAEATDGGEEAAAAEDDDGPDDAEEDEEDDDLVELEDKMLQGLPQSSRCVPVLCICFHCMIFDRVIID